MLQLLTIVLVLPVDGIGTICRRLQAILVGYSRNTRHLVSLENKQLIYTKKTAVHKQTFKIRGGWKLELHLNHS